LLHQILFSQGCRRFRSKSRPPLLPKGGGKTTEKPTAEHAENNDSAHRGGQTDSNGRGEGIEKCKGTRREKGTKKALRKTENGQPILRTQHPGLSASGDPEARWRLTDLPKFLFQERFSGQRRNPVVGQGSSAAHAYSGRPYSHGRKNSEQTHTPCGP
jgi:hypothetical protein